MIYIRTDMNDIIATGHVMRCLAIADAAKSLGEDTTFIVADEQPVAMFEEMGYPYIVLHTLWNNMEEELAVLQDVIKEKQIKSLLVDSYQVTEKYLNSLRNLVKVLYIDDLNAFCYPVEGIICYANYWKKFYCGNKHNKAKLYLGTKYTPLRKQFLNNDKKYIKTQIENILILSGGTDHYDILDRLIEVIDNKRYQRLDVICGLYYLKYDELKEKYSTEDNIYLHKAVSDIERYMREADVVVSAGGTTLYELCACGTPTISFSIADNQLENVKKFNEDRVIDYAGDVRRDDVIGNVKMLLENCYFDKKYREDKSQKMQQVVDGKGALRIAKIMID